MTTSPAFCPLSLQTLLDQNAAPIVGGKAWTYDAGTTTLRTVYRDPALASAHPNPILTDGFGRIPAIYVGVGAYKVVLQDQFGGEMSTADQLPGGTVDPSPPGPDTSTVIPTGFVMAAHTDGAAVDGWVVANAKTIGSNGSGATARAADDALPLYTALWNADTSLAVTGGRGASATADWNAGKAITLPDWRGRTPFGRDGMGNSAAGRISSATIATPDAVGSTGGAESIALNVGQLPTFTPSVTVASGGAHGHTGVTDSQGAHTHNATSDSQGAHSHSWTYDLSSAGGTTTPYPRLYDSGSGLQINTNTQGAHTHNITVATVGNHAHGLAIDTGGTHSHTATAAAIGSGNAHSSMPPAILTTWYIKL